MLRRYSWLLLLFILAACAHNKAELSPDTKIAKANTLFAKGKFARAALLYDDISFERKNASAPIALMRLADSYFQMHKFTDARLKYTTMTTSYPDFVEVETAYYRIGECYFEESRPAQYDQTETVQSIEAFRTFLEKFPDSKSYLNAIDYIRKAQFKLIEKKYYNGYIYYKMKDYSSAMMYFEDVINLSNQNDVDRKSLYYAIKISLYHNNQTKAEEFWQRLKLRYPVSKEYKKLARYFSGK